MIIIFWNKRKNILILLLPEVTNINMEWSIVYLEFIEKFLMIWYRILKKNYSIFIYGYGFNDDHFNAVFQDTTKDVLVLTKTIKSCFLERALKNNNWTIFYKNEENKPESSVAISYMVYKGKKYALSEDFWDINIFSELFLG